MKNKKCLNTLNRKAIAYRFSLLLPEAGSGKSTCYDLNTIRLSKITKKVIRRKAFFQFPALFVPAITLWFLGMLLTGCKNEQNRGIEQALTGRELMLLDSARAARAIVNDDTEGFFQRIGRLDMSLQMQRNYPSETSREEVLADYRTFLQVDVTDFSSNEEVVLRAVFQEIRTLCDQLAPGIFPKSIELIKTNGRHYGDGVYYTRENRIIIPANELTYLDRQRLREVLVHEVFHIISRFQPHKRAALYDRIGFRQLPGDLVLPDAVASRLLLNPDGVQMNYAITLAMAKGDTARCVPVLIANAPAYLPERPDYVAYFDFNLYSVREQANGSFTVLADSLGRSPIWLAEQPDFFRQIGDNTFYVIHPDEIMADNFKWLVLSRTGAQGYRLERFSEVGQQLLREIEAILKK